MGRDGGQVVISLSYTPTIRVQKPLEVYIFFQVTLLFKSSKIKQTKMPGLAHLKKNGISACFNFQILPKMPGRGSNYSYFNLNLPNW